MLGPEHVGGEFGNEVWPAADHFVVNGRRADDLRLAAGLSGLQTEQRDDVALIGMEQHVRAGLIAAMVRVLVVQSHIGDMADHVAVGVVR